MTTKRLFELFILNNTKGRDGVNPNANYIRTYGNVPFEEAFEVYLSNVASFISLKDKITKFEKFPMTRKLPILTYQKVDITSTMG